MSVLDEIRDTREKKGGWAMGYYTNKCKCCGKVFVGDKRASSCAPCAYGDVEIITDPATIAEMMGGEIQEALTSTPAKTGSTSQWQDIVDLIRGVDGRHEEDIATALLTKYKIEAI